ncbi:MAG: tetratricopeptide repeat protein [Myxococcota bacterium]
MRFLASAVFVLALCTASTAFAQDGGEESARTQDRPAAELTEEQLVLNDEAVRSLIEGDYAGAVAMLTRSIKLGASNVAYLNLGRAYQKMGNCEDAREALEKVETAPVVENPPPSEVNKRADEFLGELEQECDADEQPAEPGAEEGDPAKTSGEPPESEELPNPRLRPEPTAPPEESGSSRKTWGIVTLASGLAIAGGGVGLHLWAVDERSQIEEAGRNGDGQIDEFTQAEAETIQDEANTLDTVGLGMILGGAVLTGVGTYLFVTSDSEAQQSQLSVSPGRDNVTVQWRMKF